VTWENAGPHSAEPSIADKDEVGGSSPPRPTIRPLTSGNAAQSLGLSSFPLISISRPESGLRVASWLSEQRVCWPLGSLPGRPSPLHSGRTAHYFAVLRSTRSGEQREARTVGAMEVDAANVIASNRSRSDQPHPLPGRGRAATAMGDHCLSRPSRWAIAAASPRPATPSLARILETWTLAVLGVM
jgi:hypothetical protein